MVSYTYSVIVAIWLLVIMSMSECGSGVCGLNVPRLFAGVKDINEAKKICPKLPGPSMRPGIVETADIALG